MTTVAEVMRKKPIHTVSPGETLRRAASKMASEKIGSLLVVENELRLLGIITERDLVKAISDGADFDSVKVEEYMTKKLVVARPEDSIVSAAHKMVHHEVRHLPVVDSTNRVVGILSIRDVLRHVLAEHEFP
ncbi:MAG: CBS domain-containing protein [Desulfurococcales archaeon]|nr:CBS domain-containing protein [Desulfurococcales archaeon]